MTREHDIENENCWCKPHLEQPCPELVSRKEDGEGVKRCPPSCWRCAGVSYVAPYDDDGPLLVIHNDDDFEDDFPIEMRTDQERLEEDGQ